MLAGRCKTQLGPMMCLRGPSFSSPRPPSHDWYKMRTTHPLSFGGHDGLFKLSSEHCFISTQTQCHMDLWSAWLVLTHHHHLHRHRIPLHQNPTRKSRPELFSDSHLSFPRGRSPWVRHLFTRTSLPPGYHGNHLIWVDSSLKVFLSWFWESWPRFENLGLRYLGPPPPHHPKN